MDNDIRKIKKNTYLKIKDHYEKKIQEYNNRYMSRII